MGQRHQIFIVARVATRDSAARYRCVGAYHHQWCYGRLPLKAARRFITLIKQKDNAAIVKDELRAMQVQDSEAQVPCPYSTFLMATACCVDLQPPEYYGHGVSFSNSVLDAGMGSADGDNNDGITIFDITDSTNPSYCFVSVFGLEAVEARVQGRVPLSAEQYARAYYPLPKEGMAYNDEKDAERAKIIEEDVQKTIDSLREERLMTLDVLAEAWPEEYERPAQTAPSAADDCIPVATPSNPFPRLAELSLGPAVEHAIQKADTDELEGLVWHPGKAASIRSILQGHSPFPDSGLSLLGQVIQHEAKADKTTLNLSCLSLSGTQVASLLASSGMMGVESLDLSHNSRIDIAAIREILSTTKLRRVTLLDTQISDEQIYQLITEEPNLFKTLEALVHPALLSWQNPAQYPNHFTYICASEQSSAAVSLAICTPASIVQCLTDLLGPVKDAPLMSLYGLLSSSLIPQAAFATGVRVEGQPWNERSVGCFPALTDTPFASDGWLFAARFTLFGGGGKERYGFVRCSVTAETQTVSFAFHSLGEFLQEMKAEGRPLPTESAVKRLEEILTFWESKGSKFWNEEDFVSDFIPTFNMYNMRRY
ncbi:hypothetical protein FB45DRAFT_1023481 [Roridomyces roridus]|uniref:Uncharacterized protein n=1 Tax=Roridomyces roridus TaxID=1738132 RepID=A0AAD7FR65_9AGAR|nr:hypothetical protein FB45DRAFT_1023481 [Roridomyces roridus]